MSAAAPNAEIVAPLLLELARAIRARGFYPAAHPTVQGALRRAAVAWRDCLARHGTLRIYRVGCGFAVGDGDPVHGLGLDELAEILRERGVGCFDTLPGLDLRELATLVDLLAGGTPEPLADLIAAHRLDHVRVGGEQEIGEAEPPSATAVQPPQVATAPEDEPLLGAETDTPAEAPPQSEAPVAAEQEVAAVPTPAAASSGSLTPDGAELLRELAAFERCTKLGEYERTADGIDSRIRRLIEAKNPFEAYRALLVYARHAADTQGRSTALREVAITRLRRMQDDEQILRYVAGRALSRSTLTSVQAIQVLGHLGGPAVRVLLEAQDDATSHEQRQLVSILIAMGDEALPAIVDELAAPDASRVSRAVVILGDMQNPRGVEFLAGMIRHRDRRVAREAARSLARIGDEHALDALIEALSDAEEVALLAASCLGGSRTRTAMRALLAAVPEESGHSEPVRQEAVRSLGRIGNPASLDCLIEILDRAPLFQRGRVRALRCAAAHAVARVGGQAALEALQAHARSGDPAVRQACRQALREVERC